MVSYNSMNRFALIFFLSAFVHNVWPTTAQSLATTGPKIIRAPEGIYLVVPESVFETMFLEDRGEYQNYLTLMLENLYTDRKQQTFEFHTFQYWFLEENLKTVPDVKLLSSILAPLKKESSSLAPETRRQVTAYLEVYLNSLRLFNYKDELLNDVDEDLASRDYDGHLIKQDRELYHTIKADLLAHLNPEFKPQFERSLDVASKVQFLPPMTFLEWSLFGTFSSVWINSRAVYRQYLKDMYEHEPAVHPDIKKVQDLRMEKRQYLIDLWTIEGKKGNEWDEEVDFKDRDFTHLTTITTPLTRPIAVWLQRKVYKYLLVRLFALKLSDIRRLTDKEQYAYLRKTLVQVVDPADFEKLVARNLQWTELQEKVEGEERQAATSVTFLSPMTNEVYDETYGSRYPYVLYLRDMYYAVSPAHQDVRATRKKLWSTEHNKGTTGDLDSSGEVFLNNAGIHHIEALIGPLKSKTLVPDVQAKAYDFLLVSCRQLKTYQLRTILELSKYRGLRKDIRDTLHKDQDTLVYHTFNRLLWKKIFLKVEKEDPID